MRNGLWLLTAALLITCGNQPARGASIQTVNAASFSAASVAPGSIVTIWGTAMTNATASVTDPAHPPTTLGSTTVTIGGVPATLFFVSPTQINAVVAATVTAGTQPVVVTSPTGTANGTVVVELIAPPGLFSLTGTGTNEGAIIQALAGRVGAFSVTDGSKPNFLTLFLTGANFTTPPVVTVGGVSANITFSGASPCCLGLQQINLTLPASLTGAGRVPVVLQAGGKLSNVVEIVILPAAGSGTFSGDHDNETRSRELAGIAWIPGTSFALVTDENDDVVREIDITAKSVIHTIALAADAEPTAIAINSAGTLAVVAERNRGRVAIINLTTLAVVAEIPVGAGPVNVAITGSVAVVVNGDNDSVTLVDLVTNTPSGPISVGRGARGVAISAAGIAYVTNQNDGTISVIDLAAKKVLSTIALADSRPGAIQLIGTTGFAAVADPAISPNGRVLLVNLATGVVTPFSVNLARNGGASDIVALGNTLYVANQTGGSISILPLTIAGTVVTGTATALNVDMGARSLAIDVKDNLLLAVNQSSGSITIVNLANNQVVGRIQAVVGASGEGDDNDDDHSDHDHAANLPQLTSVSPTSAKAGATITVTVTGKNLAGTDALVFVFPGNGIGNGNGNGNNGNGKGKGKGSGKSNGGSARATADTAFTVKDMHVNAAGTEITATVTVNGKASPGARFVRVATPNGDSGENLRFNVLP